MKKLSKTLMLATAGAALAVVQAQAAGTFSYSSGDLLLDFRPNASQDTKDITIDLGSMSALRAEAVGGVVSLNQFVPYIETAESSSLDNLSWSVLGTDTANHIWVTQDAGSVPGSSATPTDASISASQGQIGSIGLNANAGGTRLAINQAVTTVEVSKSPFYDYAHYMGGGGNLGGKSLWGDLETSTGTGFTGSSPVVYDVADLYIDDANAPAGSAMGYEGSFILGSDGTLQFDVAPIVPEPMTYGLLSGLGLLAVSLRHQIRRLRA
jgi:hypothetical protein